MPRKPGLNWGFYLQFPFRNLLRHPRRTLLTGSAVGFAAATLCFMFSYFNGVINNVSARYARLESGHLRIANQEYLKKESLLPLDAGIQEADSLEALIARQPDISAVTERIRFGAMASRGDLSFPVLGMGIDFDREKDFLNPGALLQAGRLPDASGREIVVGNILAKRLELQVGDTLLLLGQDSHHSLSANEYRISGLVSLGMNPIDRRSIYLPLESARKFTDLPGRSTEILALLDHPNRGTQARDRLESLPQIRQQPLKVLTWREHGDLYRVISSSQAIVQLLILLFLAIAASTVVNTILMAVLERGREVGMLKALGMSRLNVAGLFLLEAAAIAVAFAPLGGLIGAAASAYAQHVGIPLGKVGQQMTLPLGNVIYPEFRWAYYLRAVAFSLGMSLLAALYPAWKAGKIQSATALRVHQ